MPTRNAFEKILDPYDRPARLVPGLLVLLPGMLFLVTTYGATHPVSTAITTLLIACGGPYALTNLVRTWGQRAQARLYTKWGGKPSTILLRHSDKRLAVPTKRRYHDLAQNKLGIQMPTPEDEKAAPSVVDGVYASVADRLIDATRDAKHYPLVFKELVGYGFNRNCYGIRWLGAALSVGTCIAVLFREHSLLLRSPYFALAALEGLDVGDGATLFVSIAFLFAWLFHFTPATVEQSGFSYAERLYESLNHVSRAAAKSTKGTAA